MKWFLKATISILWAFDHLLCKVIGILVNLGCLYFIQVTFIRPLIEHTDILSSTKFWVTMHVIECKGCVQRVCVLCCVLRSDDTGFKSDRSIAIKKFVLHHAYIKMLCIIWCQSCICISMHIHILRYICRICLIRVALSVRRTLSFFVNNCTFLLYVS